MRFFLKLWELVDGHDLQVENFPIVNYEEYRNNLRLLAYSLLKKQPMCNWSMLFVICSSFHYLGDSSMYSHY